ncbi:MAG: recombinase family protein [Bacillota bacterium]
MPARGAIWIEGRCWFWEETLGGGHILTVIYGRVSTEEQYRSGFSLSEQMKACRLKAQALAKAANETASVVEFTDDLSGELLERPGLQSALDLVRREQVAYFICLDPDRLARRLMHQLLVTDEIERNRCRLEFVQHDYQESPEGRLFYQMRGAIAEFEKAKILERTSRGQRGKIAAGGLPHVVRMYGYEFIKGAGKHAQAREVMIPHPQEAEWVRQIYRWCTTERIGPLTIANRLNHLGIPTKTGQGEWQHTQVRRILSHPTYATGLLALGKKDHKGIGVARRLPKRQREEKGIVLTAKPKPEAQWQYVEITPLVDQEVWEQAQAVLDGFRVGKRRTGGRDEPRPLSGLGRCGLCGGKLYYLNGTKIVCANRYAKYWSSRDKSGSSCDLPAKPRAAVEAAVWAEVEQWLTDPVRLAEEVERLSSEGGSAGAIADNQAEAAMLQGELQQREAELERLGLLFAKGFWPQEKALPAIEEVNRQITALRGRLMALSAPVEEAVTTEPGFLVKLLSSPELQTEVVRTLEDLTPEKREELIRLAVLGFVLEHSPRGASPQLRVQPAIYSPP